MSHNIFWGTASDHPSTIVQLIPEYATPSKHQISFRKDCISPRKMKTQIQTMCILCLHCMISIKKTCTVHRVTANVISFQWGGRFCLCTLALAHNENLNGTTAACILSSYWYSIMAVLSRLNNIYGIVLHADHIFYCALMLINVYVQLFTPCTVI